MINLNPISFPVSSTPETPPPVGSYYVYFQPNGTLVRMDWNSAVERMTSKISFHEVELVQRTDILRIPNTQAIQIDKAATENLAVGDSVQITGSQPQNNDGTYIVSDITDVPTNPFGFVFDENPTPGNPAEKVNLTLVGASLNPFLLQFGELLLAKEAVINHSVSDPVLVTFKNLDTNEAEINIRHSINDQTVSIRPSRPISGLVRVSILG